MSARAEEAPAKHAADDQPSCERLWRIIGRFDAYYATTNTKGALLGAFAASVLAALVVKGEGMVTAASPTGQTVQRALIVVAQLGVLVALGCVMSAITPFGTPPKGRPRSAIYFEDVRAAALSEFQEHVLRKSDREFAPELATQAHALALGLSRKFMWLAWAARIVLVAVLLPVAVVIVAGLW